MSHQYLENEGVPSEEDIREYSSSYSEDYGEYDPRESLHYYFQLTSIPLDRLNRIEFNYSIRNQRSEDDSEIFES